MKAVKATAQTATTLKRLGTDFNLQDIFVHFDSKEGHLMFAVADQNYLLKFDHIF